mmetsp:Transcript_35919/g.34963  ORF Transcript_35919/g.34963 Transcript_35919/m.34963 type:complete len:108 (-) Transcript_35919:193-516(-)
MAYSIASIIESPKIVNPKMQYLIKDSKPDSENKNPNQSNDNFQRAYFKEAQASSISDLENRNADFKVTQIQNFWMAYDALEIHNKHLLDFGIELAKTVQQAIVRIGT